VLRLASADNNHVGKLRKGDDMFKVEVIADNSGKWAGNGLTFETKEAAEKYGRNLMSRWMAVREWRVVEVEAAFSIESSGPVRLV